MTANCRYYRTRTIIILGSAKWAKINSAITLIDEYDVYIYVSFWKTTLVKKYPLQ